MRVHALSNQELVSRVDELLEAQYRSASLGNKSDPLEEAVFISLSRQTREPVYTRVYEDLRKRFATWRELLRAPDVELSRILRPAGLHKQRAAQLKALLIEVEAENQRRAARGSESPTEDLNLDFLHGLNDEDAERLLVSLPGIGPKSARCVLAYSLNREKFAVDTHVRRVFSRLGLWATAEAREIHNPLQDAVPKRIRKRLHMNLVHHGRAICRSRNPKCRECSLVSFCLKGRRAVGCDERPVAVDLFAGAGGLGFGFSTAGFRVALAIESDRHAAQTYRLNNPGSPVIEAEINAKTSRHDLTQFMPGVENIAALLAGLPCQGYSVAGSRDPGAKENLHYRRVAKLARELSAETVCIENVPGLRRVRGRGFLGAILRSFRRAGYAIDAHLVNARDFGVPQHRARFLFLGRRGTGVTAPAKPMATHRAHKHEGPGTLPGIPNLTDSLKALPELPAGATGEPAIGPDGAEYFNVETMAHSESVVEKISKIKPGEGPISYRRLNGDVARTLIAGHRALPVHPWLNRTISVREAATIQGFPHEFRFCGPRSSQPLQVANAVPPPLAVAAAKQLKRTVLGELFSKPIPAR